jgi:hypothetical protein
MKTLYPCIKKITRDQLRNVTFKKAEALLADGIDHQGKELQFSVLLASHPMADVKIIFNTITGYCELIDSVWGTTQKHLLLKSGTFMPTDAIASIESAAF